jgi:hypothetical protein
MGKDKYTIIHQAHTLHVVLSRENGEWITSTHELAMMSKSLGVITKELCINVALQI